MTASPSRHSVVVSEIRTALLAAPDGALTTLELTEACPSVEDSRELAKIVYELRTVGALDLDPIPGPIGAENKPAKRYRWADPTVECPRAPPRPRVKTLAKTATTASATPQMGPAHSPPPPTPELSPMPATPSPAAPPDTIGETLERICRETDIARLVLADALLADNPAWCCLREVSATAASALLDHQLARELKEEATHGR